MSNNYQGEDDDFEKITFKNLVLMLMAIILVGVFLPYAFAVAPMIMLVYALLKFFAR